MGCTAGKKYIDNGDKQKHIDNHDRRRKYWQPRQTENKSIDTRGKLKIHFQPRQPKEVLTIMYVTYALLTINSRGGADKKVLTTMTGKNSVGNMAGKYWQSRQETINNDGRQKKVLGTMESKKE